MPVSDDPEPVLDVLARLVAAGDPWAISVESRRQERLGRLSEAEKKTLRGIAERERVKPRPTVTAQDETDVQAIVEAYVSAQRTIVKDKAFVALEVHFRDARSILGDARRLAERAKCSAADVVAHKLERYVRDQKNAPAFPLRFLFDRTEQDDLPRQMKKPKELSPIRADTKRWQRPIELPTSEELEEIRLAKEELERIGTCTTQKKT